jgi:hypothetical protein
MKGGWLKLYRERPGLDLILRHPHALALLTLVATRARYKSGRDPVSGVELQVGEALTGRGDSEKIGASPKQYRVAREQLIRWGFVTISMATSGATRGTVIKLTNTCIYEVLPILSGQQADQLQATPRPPAIHESRKSSKIHNIGHKIDINPDIERTRNYLKSLNY